MACIAMALMLGLGHGRGAEAGSVPHYEVGDIAREDVRSPMVLEVVDLERTEEARRQASARIPMVYLFDLRAGLEAETALRKDFEAMRTQFWVLMEQASRRSKLDAETVRHASFARFTEWFREQHPGFPMGTSLAALWAMREPDEAVLERWLGSLRQAMNLSLGPESGGEGEGSGSDWVRIVPMAEAGVPVTERMVEKDGMTLRAEALGTVSRARAGLISEWGRDSSEVGVYVGRFARENCVPQRELTRRMREKAAAAVLVVDRYESGAMLVESGQVVDRKIKTALDLLRAELGLEKHAARAGTHGRGSWMSRLRERWHRMQSDPVRLEEMAGKGLVVLAGFSLGGMVVLAVLVSRKRRRRRKAQAPASREMAYTVVLNPSRNETVFLPAAGTASGAAGVAPGAGGDETGEGGMTAPEADSGSLSKGIAEMDRYWQQRAAEAERRAELILTQVRAGLAPQLARHMMHRLVQELVTQRAQWVEAQRLAEMDLAHIEKRLVASHEHMQEQLRAFERRTAELEKALSLKAEENTALIKAQIAVMQKKAGPPVDVQEPIWN